MIKPYDAWVFACLVSGQTLNGEMDAMSSNFKRMASHLNRLSKKARGLAWLAMMEARDDSENLIQAVADQDLSKPPPPVDKPVEYATVADIRKTMAVIRWNWEGWIPAVRLLGLASLEGTGKTRTAMDLHRRVYRHLPWPDGQEMTLPKESPAIWMCADGQHEEIADLVKEYDLPDSSVIFPASCDDPWENTSLDDSETLASLHNVIAARKPWVVCVDSLSYATTRDLCEQKTIAILKKPLVNLVQKHQINVLLLLHLSASGQALGRRIKGITRTLMHLECPDPNKSERLRFWIEKSYGKKPPVLGVTMGDRGNEYDSNPPAKPNAKTAGRPSDQREKAAQFIREALTASNDQIANDLAAECHKLHEVSEPTFWRAVDDLKQNGEIVTEGGPGTGRRTVLHLIPGENEF